VVGPNGAGKSTLLKLLLGFLRPKAGKVFLFGKELSQFNEWEKLGYVPQRFSVERFWTGTVEELLRKVAKKEKVGWIIAFLHLENLLKRQFVKLSGGEQQKVLLALALTKNPSLLILDEPMTGLDIHAQEHIEHVLREISKDRTVVVVSHDLGFVMRNASRMLCLGMPECRVVYPKDFGQIIRELYGLH
jgi:zinc transport system ATP-binding protein